MSATLALSVRSYERGRAGERETRRGVLHGDVCRAGSASRNRDHDFRDELPLLECGRERTGDEVLYSDRPGARGRLKQELAAERDQYRRHVRGRIGVGEASADRAAIPHLKVADPLRALVQRYESGSRELGCSRELVPRRKRSDVEIVAASLDTAKLERADVDEQRRPGDAELHHRQKRLPSGDRLRVRLGKELERLVERRRTRIPERGRDHDVASSRSATAAAWTDSTIVW